mmetsp:Transcript_11541/g.17057  ORF Transcript_11541/g.17057 Transcript_11541/m.17057 type:complete len:100 (-) Transcript_11541:3-302(-)
MDPVPGALVLQGDLTTQDTRDSITQHLQGGQADVVLSDLAPNLMGDSSTDHLRSVDLAREALDFAVGCLAPGGSFLCKYFQGNEEKEFHEEVRTFFQQS